MNEKPDLAKAMMLYKDNMSEDLAALWKVRETFQLRYLFLIILPCALLPKVWVPSTVLNFAFMPM